MLKAKSKAPPPFAARRGGSLQNTRPTSQRSTSDLKQRLLAAATLTESFGEETPSGFALAANERLLAVARIPCHLDGMIVAFNNSGTADFSMAKAPQPPRRVARRRAGKSPDGNSTNSIP
jgi:hypothetical protein